jgi:hypothetical protein
MSKLLKYLLTILGGFSFWFCEMSYAGDRCADIRLEKSKLQELANSLQENPEFSESIGPELVVYMRMLREPVKSVTALSENLSMETKPFTKLASIDTPNRRVVFLTSIRDFNQVFNGRGSYLENLGFPKEQIPWYLSNYKFQVVLLKPGLNAKILPAKWQNLPAIIEQVYIDQPQQKELLLFLINKHMEALINDLSLGNVLEDHQALDFIKRKQYLTETFANFKNIKSVNDLSYSSSAEEFRAFLNNAFNFNTLFSGNGFTVSENRVQTAPEFWPADLNLKEFDDYVLFEPSEVNIPSLK